MERAKDMSVWDIHFAPQFPSLRISPEGRLIPSRKALFEEELLDSEAEDSDQDLDRIRMSDIVGVGFREGKESKFETLFETLGADQQADCSFDLQDFDFPESPQTLLTSVISEPDFQTTNRDLRPAFEPDVSSSSAAWENAPNFEEPEMSNPSSVPVSEQPLRSSKRHRVPPLVHWLNETLHYSHDNTLAGCLEVYPKSDLDSLLLKRRKPNPTTQSTPLPEFPTEISRLLMSVYRPRSSLVFEPYPDSKVTYCVIISAPTMKLFHMRFPPKSELDGFRYLEGYTVGYYHKGKVALKVKVDALCVEPSIGDYFYVQAGSTLTILNSARSEIEIMLVLVSVRN